MIMRKEKGRAPRPLEFYKASHQRKDGTYKEDSSSKEFVDTAEALIDECVSKTAVPRETAEKQVFNKLMYESQSDQDKKYQRVVGYGMGVTYNEVFAVNSEIRNRGFIPINASTEEEVVRLRADVVRMKSQLDLQSQQIQEQSQQIQHQSEQMQGMQRQMQAEFQNITSLLRKLVGHSDSGAPSSFAVPSHEEPSEEGSSSKVLSVDAKLNKLAVQTSDAVFKSQQSMKKDGIERASKANR